MKLQYRFYVPSATLDLSHNKRPATGVKSNRRFHTFSLVILYHFSWASRVAFYGCPATPNVLREKRKRDKKTKGAERQSRKRVETNWDYIAFVEDGSIEKFLRASDLVHLKKFWTAFSFFSTSVYLFEKCNDLIVYECLLNKYLTRKSEWHDMTDFNNKNVCKQRKKENFTWFFFVFWNNNYNDTYVNGWI